MQKFIDRNYDKDFSARCGCNNRTLLLKDPGPSDALKCISCSMDYQQAEAKWINSIPGLLKEEGDAIASQLVRFDAKKYSPKFNAKRSLVAMFETTIYPIFGEPDGPDWGDKALMGEDYEELTEKYLALYEAVLPQTHRTAWLDTIRQAANSEEQKKAFLVHLTPP